MVKNNKNVAVNLLFIERTINSAEEKVSILRNAGIAVHPEVACDHSELELASSIHDLDIILFSAPIKNLDLLTAAKVCREQFEDVPMIATAGDQDPKSLLAAMQEGVRHVVFTDDPEHLVLVVRRELEDLKRRRALQRLEESLQESEQRCAVLMKSSRDAIVYVHEGMHIDANAAYLQMFGYTDMEEIEGLPVLEMIESEERPRFKKFLRTLGEETEELEINCLKHDGEIFKSKLEFSTASIDGEPCTQIVFRIQRESKNLEQALDRLRNTDSGTGLFNRDYFISQLQPMLDEQRERSDVFAMLYLSLDGFHEIRTRIGLSGSDKLLSEIAHVINGNLHDEDLVARFGDHSFTLVTRREDRSAIKIVAENLLNAVAGHLFQSERDLIEPTCSIGIAYLDERILSGQDLINNADHACKISDDKGGNQITLFDPVKMGSKFAGADDVSEARITQLIIHALANDRFKLVYQPIVSLQGESAENYAVLVRLLDNNDSEILPNYFLPYVREEKLEPRLDRWVTEKALAELANQRTDERKTRFFVNLCGATLEDEEFLVWLNECLEKYSVQGSWLTFQAQESDLRARMTVVTPFLEGLRKTGVRVAISHFGRHSKAETLLKHIPFDYVKFDTSLITELTKDQHIQDRVSGLTEQIHEHGAKSVAAGVEDANTLAVLWNIGINCVQGYFLQEPSEEISFEALAGSTPSIEP